jgi:hypothetical protein
MHLNTSRWDGRTRTDADLLEADFLATESSGRLAQAVRQTVQSNRRHVVKAA